MANSSDTPHYPQDVPFEVPEGWAWTTVNNISKSIIYGVSESAKSEGKYKLLRITDIQNNKVDWETVPFTDFDDDKVASYILYDGDIVFARTGATVGKSYLIKGLSQKAIYASYLIRVQTFDLILPEYVKLFFESGYYWEQIELTSVGIGQPNVNGTILGSLNIPLPPFAEQKRIVIEKDRWLSLLEQIEQGKANLQIAIKQTKSKILDLAIHGKLVPQDPNDEPASELLKRINPKVQITCDNEHSRKLPYNWCLCNLGDVCMLENGFAFSSDQYKAKGIPLIRISNIKDNEISLSSCVFINEGYEEKYIVHSGDLLIAMSGATTGKMGIYNQKYVAYLNQRVGNIKIVDSNLLFDKYRNYFLFSQKNKILELAYGGAQPNISGKVINSLFVPLPPIAEQKRIVQKIEVLFSIIDTVEQALQAEPYWATLAKQLPVYNFIHYLLLLICCPA